MAVVVLDLEFVEVDRSNLVGEERRRRENGIIHSRTKIESLGIVSVWICWLACHFGYVGK